MGAIKSKVFGDKTEEIEENTLKIDNNSNKPATTPTQLKRQQQQQQQQQQASLSPTSSSKSSSLQNISNTTTTATTTHTNSNTNTNNTTINNSTSITNKDYLDSETKNIKLPNQLENNNENNNQIDSNNNNSNINTTADYKHQIKIRNHSSLLFDQSTKKTNSPTTINNNSNLAKTNKNISIKKLNSTKTTTTTTTPPPPLPPPIITTITTTTAAADINNNKKETMTSITSFQPPNHLQKSQYFRSFRSASRRFFGSSIRKMNGYSNNNNNINSNNNNNENNQEVSSQENASNQIGFDATNTSNNKIINNNNYKNTNFRNSQNSNNNNNNLKSAATASAILINKPNLTNSNREEREQNNFFPRRLKSKSHTDLVNRRVTIDNNYNNNNNNRPIQTPTESGRNSSFIRAYIAPNSNTVTLITYEKPPTPINSIHQNANQNSNNILRSTTKKIRDIKNKDRAKSTYLEKMSDSINPESQASFNHSTNSNNNINYGISNVNSRRSTSDNDINFKSDEQIFNENIQRMATNSSSSLDNYEEIDNENKIEHLKKQIELLNKQVELINREDSKIINELSEKIDNLAKLNYNIISAVGAQKENKMKNLSGRHKNLTQNQVPEDYYNSQLNRQNDILLMQQNQIEQLRQHLYNSSTYIPQPQSPTPQSIHQSYVYPEGFFSQSLEGFYNPNVRSAYPNYANAYPHPHPHAHHHHHNNAYYYPQQARYHPQPVPNLGAAYHPNYPSHVHPHYYMNSNVYPDSSNGNAYYYQNYQQQPVGNPHMHEHLHAHPTQSQSQTQGSIYYDPLTGQYYYQRNKPPTTTPYFYSQPGVYANVFAFRNANASASEMRPGSDDEETKPSVIITEVSDDDEDLDDIRKLNREAKKDYVDAISLNEEEV